MHVTNIIYYSRDRRLYRLATYDIFSIMCLFMMELCEIFICCDRILHVYLPKSVAEILV